MGRQSRAQRLIAAVQSRGNDADDARDAAHEASHALQVEAVAWGREDIHNRLKRRTRSFWLASEIQARAVEALVCKALGIEYDVDKWALISFMESIKGLGFAMPMDSADYIRRAMLTKDVRDTAAAILKLRPVSKRLAGINQVGARRRIVAQTAQV